MQTSTFVSKTLHEKHISLLEVALIHLLINSFSFNYARINYFAPIAHFIISIHFFCISFIFIFRVLWCEPARAPSIIIVHFLYQGQGRGCVRLVSAAVAGARPVNWHDHSPVCHLTSSERGTLPSAAFLQRPQGYTKSAVWTTFIALKFFPWGLIHEKMSQVDYILVFMVRNWLNDELELQVFLLCC
jgi:hypothetical protein